jgi:hypothetical protein
MKKVTPFILTLLMLLPVCSSFGQFKLYEKGHDSYKAGRYEEAIKLFSEYLTKPTRDKKMDVDVHYLRGLSYFKKEDYKLAIGDFEECLLLHHPNKGNIHWFKAKCYAKQGIVPDAIDDYTNAIAVLGGDNSVKAKLLLERGVLYKALDQQDLAANDFNEGLKLTPANADLKKELDALDPKKVATRSTPKKQEVVTQPVTTAVNEPVNTDKVQSNVARPANNTGKERSNTTKQPISTNKEQGSIAKTETVAPPVAPVVNPLAEAYKDEKRYALVIGNSAYPKTIGVLRNPVNDATDLAKELKASNFDVQLLTNATYGQMRAAMLKFKEKIDAGDKEKTVSLFYFAGHGLQHEDENYLVPIDAMIEYQDDIGRYCFGVQKMVLANMERSNSRMNIVILDACRNNPFPALTRSMGDQGLGEMRRARGSFIAYATAPGSVASDGTGRNGLYTQELLKAIRKPGLTIEQVFKQVRANVLQLSNDKQNTWDSSNIVGEFYFKF